jgi:hypothetical protein
VVGRYGRCLHFRTGLWPGVAAWVAGSNKYKSEVPPEREAGEHEIVISLKSGWSQLVPDLKGCELLRQRVTVQSDRTLLIIAGTSCTLLVAVLLLAIYVMRSHRAATKRILVSFMKHEGVLGVKLAWEFWVREP